MAGFGQVRRHEYDRAARSEFFRSNFAGLTAFERHQRLLQQLGAYGAQGDAGSHDPAAMLAGTRSDADALRQSYRFIRRPEDDAPDTWEVRLARRYYDRLFREYAIADLSRYEEQKVGLRWRTEAEVASGKGQFICGAKGCSIREGLASYELMFRYREEGQDKAALVKLRVCPGCAATLNHGRSSAQRYKPTSGGTSGKVSGSSDKQQRHRSRSRSRSRERDRKKGKKGKTDKKRRRSGLQSPSRSRSRSRSRGRAKDRSHSKEGGRERRGGYCDVEGATTGAVEGSAAAAVPTDEDIDRWLEDLFA